MTSMAELGLHDTGGILRQPWIQPERTSAGLGWQQMYVSTQHELPYQAAFDAAGSHLLILHLSGPVTVRRGQRGLTRSRRIPSGGMFVHPAGRELTVELGGELDTVHVYVSDAAVQEASGEGRPVELAEEFGASDPLLEQLVLSLDGALRGWEPSALTYVDQLRCMLAAQLAHRCSVERPEPPAPTGLTGPGFAAVLQLLEARLAEPIPLADMAAVAGLSVSQFSRRFKATTGLSPHRYLLRLRVEQAGRMLRTGSLPIADVAVACGFSHQEHLTRVMRAQLGMTPAALRRTG
jgi:AraC family transcriptional regulator